MTEQVKILFQEWADNPLRPTTPHYREEQAPCIICGAPSSICTGGHGDGEE